MKIESMVIQHLFACSIFGLAAFTLSISVLPWQGWREMIFASALGAFLSTLFLWKKFILLHPNPTIWRGAGIGVLISILSYPISWYLVLLYGYITGATDSLGGKAANPVESIAGAFIMSFASFIFLGWLTVLIGAIIGMIVTKFSNACQ